MWIRVAGRGRYYGIAHNHPALMPPGKCNPPWAAATSSAGALSAISHGGAAEGVGIPIRGIVFRDVRIERSQTCAGIFACSAQTNCTGIVMQNVTAVGSKVNEWDCANAFGVATAVSPPACLRQK